jgi:hypothetical protein
VLGLDLGEGPLGDVHLADGQTDWVEGKFDVPEGEYEVDQLARAENHRRKNSSLNQNCLAFTSLAVSGVKTVKRALS